MHPGKLLFPFISNLKAQAAFLKTEAEDQKKGMTGTCIQQWISAQKVQPLAAQVAARPIRRMDSILSEMSETVNISFLVHQEQCDHPRGIQAGLNQRKVNTWASW